MVVIESETIEKNRQFAERIGAKLEAETNLFTDVFYKGDLPMMGAKALLFVPENDLRNLKGTLQDDAPFIRQFTQTTNLVSFFDQINTAFRTAPRETNAQTESLIGSLPALTRIVTQADASLNRPGTPPSPGVTALFDAGDEAVRKTYITFANGKIFLVTAHAVTHDLNGKAVERIRQLMAETQGEVPGLNVGLTGEPVLEHDEMAQSQKDTTRGQHCGADFVRADFHLRLQRNRPAGEGDDLPRGRAGLYAGVCDGDGRALEHFDNHVCADSHRAGD